MAQPLDFIWIEQWLLQPQLNFQKIPLLFFMPYIYYNALHEAGHTVIALCLGCEVEKIFIDETLLLTSRWTFHPGKTPPFTPYAIQLAGAIAVQIQNEKLNRSDDDGFGKSDEIGSDSGWVSRIQLYLKNMGMTDDWIASSDKTLRKVVRDLLLKHWNVVEAIAREVANIVPSTKPEPGFQLQELPASQIGVAVQEVDEPFYHRVKTFLISNR